MWIYKIFLSWTSPQGPQTGAVSDTTQSSHSYSRGSNHFPPRNWCYIKTGNYTWIKINQYRSDACVLKLRENFGKDQPFTFKKVWDTKLCFMLWSQSLSIIWVGLGLINVFLCCFLSCFFVLLGFILFVLFLLLLPNMEDLRTFAPITTARL